MPSPNRPEPPSEDGETPAAGPRSLVDRDLSRIFREAAPARTRTPPRAAPSRSPPASPPVEPPRSAAGRSGPPPAPAAERPPRPDLVLHAHRRSRATPPLGLILLSLLALGGAALAARLLWPKELPPSADESSAPHLMLAYAPPATSAPSGAGAEVKAQSEDAAAAQAPLPSETSPRRTAPSRPHLRSRGLAAARGEGPETQETPAPPLSAGPGPGGEIPRDYADLGAPAPRPAPLVGPPPLGEAKGSMDDSSSAAQAQLRAQALRQADRRLRQAFFEAAGAGVPGETLQSLRGSWAEARERYAEDPGALIAAYGRLTAVLKAAADRAEGAPRAPGADDGGPRRGRPPW